MKKTFTLDLVQGANGSLPTKLGLQKNIDAVQRAVDGKSCCSDFVLLLDTISILEGIQKQLISG